MSVIAGEVIHIVKCMSVEVTIEHGERCFNQLQVTRNNETWYVTPRTHILVKRGVQVPCSNLLPSFYKINEVWYKIMPSPTETLPHSIIQSQLVNDWEYKSPTSLASSGIYTEQDLSKIRDRINFPMERPAMLNSIARGMSGIPTSHPDDSIINLIDEKTLERLAEGTCNKVWSKFMSIGTASAGFIGLLLIAQFIKLLIDTIIRGYTLQKVYGWSIHLIGAIFFVSQLNANIKDFWNFSQDYFVIYD